MKELTIRYNKRGILVPLGDMPLLKEILCLQKLNEPYRKKKIEQHFKKEAERIDKLYGGTMDKHCCNNFKSALELGLIERISCEIAEYALKNERVFMFLKFCPFCGDELEAE